MCWPCDCGSAVEDPGHRIVVDVATAYVEEQSDPREKRFVFAYTITIKNEGELPARLLTRHWIITDANGKVQEVRGEGVVGEKPVLRPGQAFEYTSWCMLATPHGSMHGTYQMVTEAGEPFDIDIPAFSLDTPQGGRTIN